MATANDSRSRRAHARRGGNLPRTHPGHRGKRARQGGGSKEPSVSSREPRRKLFSGAYLPHVDIAADTRGGALTICVLRDVLVELQGKLRQAAYTATYCCDAARKVEAHSRTDLAWAIQGGLVDVLARQIARVEAILSAHVPKGGAVARVAP